MEVLLMKKLIIVLIFLISLSSCKNKQYLIEELSGTYTFDSCVYLSPFSSSTPAYFTEIHQDNVSIVFSNSELNYDDTEGVSRMYENVTYHKKSILDHMDDVLNYGSQEIFDMFDERYDIYNDGRYTGLTLYIDGDYLFIAEISIIDYDQNVYMIRAIFSIQKAN